MDVDIEDGTRERNKIIDFLTDIEEICFKSQQRGEADLTKTQKTDIAADIFQKSKLNFLTRFGKFLQKDHLEFFKRFTEDCEECCEIDIVLKELISTNRNQAKNRRFEALKELIDGDYFSEIEMMKRNPLLYDQLVGQYLSEEEKKERDRLGEGSTLVTVLMEGIERDDAEAKRKEQAVCEVNEESEASDEEMDSDNPAPVYSRWGEFEEDQKVFAKQRTKKCSKRNVTEEEQVLLKEEFVSSMYQSFLDGKDENFDYSSVDNNEKYENVGMEQCDVEDKYFDSEEPEAAPAVDVESEDEFDIFMGALNQNPAVKSITKDIEKL